jgi:hypothetical protein
VPPEMGWCLGSDITADDGLRVTLFTPPRSACSIILGCNVTVAARGSTRGGRSARSWCPGPLRRRGCYTALRRDGLPATSESDVVCATTVVPPSGSPGLAGGVGAPALQSPVPYRTVNLVDVLLGAETIISPNRSSRCISKG